MNFTDIFIRRPVLAAVISLLIFLLGLRAVMELSLRQFPKMENTVITIITTYPGASAELIQGFITAPLQRSIAGADGIDYLTAQSNAGVSLIKAYIKLNYNPATAMTDIMSKVATVSNNLPRESNQPIIVKSTGSQIALMYIGFSSKHMNTQQITDYLMRVVQPKLQTVGGVAAAEILGGQTYAMRIWLDTEKMSAYNIATKDVVTALQNENFLSAAGQIKGKLVLLNINPKTDLNDADQFSNIVIKSSQDTLIRLKDIAKIELGAESYGTSVIFDGKTAVFIGIQATPTANPLEVIDGVKAVMPELQAHFPPDFEGKIVYDSTQYIRSSIYEVVSSIVEASIIIIIVIFLFLGSLRTVTIPIITIPLSLIGVCSLLHIMGYSLNLLTLLAMVLAIGLVVDDAIVVVENIYRHIEQGSSPFDAAITGAREIAMPIISMTTTLAAVYAPIGFMTGITGTLFKEFAFTLALSVILSGIIALTLSPMMCSKMLNTAVSQQRLVHAIDAMFENFKTRYQKQLIQVLNFRSVTIVFTMIILISCALLAYTTRTELAPTEDQNFLLTSLIAPNYANLNYLSKFTNQLNQIYRSIPETQDYFIINQTGYSINASNNASAGSGIILKPWNQRKRSQKDILGELQPKVAQIAGLTAVAFPLPSIPGSDQGLPIQFVITSTADYLVIYQVLQDLKEKAMKSGLFMYLNSDLRFDKPEIEVTIDRTKAAAMGVSTATIGNTLATLFGGNYVNRFSKEGESYLVIPQVLRRFRLNPEKINDIYVPSTLQNMLVPLSSIVSIHLRAIPNQLYQFQQLNSATLEGLMLPGKSILEGLDYLRHEAAKIFPLGVTYDYAGQSRQAIQEGYTLIFTFFFALIIIYLVLSAQFESFIDPLVILISVPMSISGALIPLQLGLATLNIYTGIGLITLIGLISKHGILIVDFANKIREKEGLTLYDAVVKSATLRLRPILMTTASMVLGVIPLIFASGAGAVSRFNIGLVISSGMLIGTCFTLFVVPAMYTLLAKDR